MPSDWFSRNGFIKTSTQQKFSYIIVYLLVLYFLKLKTVKYGKPNFKINNT